MPADIEPSPITAIASPRPFSGAPPKSRAAAKPSAAEMEVEEWAAPKGSNGLSLRLVNPERPSA